VHRQFIAGMTIALLVAAFSACGESAPRSHNPSPNPASDKNPEFGVFQRVGGKAVGFVVSVPRSWASSGTRPKDQASPDAGRTQLMLSGPLSPASTSSGWVQGSCQAGKVDLKAGTAVVPLPGRLTMRTTNTIIEIAARQSLRSVSVVVNAPSGVSAPVTFTDIYSIPAGPGHECVIAFGGPNTEQARALFQQLAATIRLT
jgi:hypothetical protein